MKGGHLSHTISHEKTQKDLSLFGASFQDSKDVFVLGSIEDITVALEDSLVTISTIATRPVRFGLGKGSIFKHHTSQKRGVI